MTSIRVGGAQLNSLINGLENSLAQIQGPPGTGKSFLGALILSFIIGLTNHKVLVISYTNHALDQFLEDLLDIGLSENDMVRLGSKATERTKPLGLNNCTSSGDSYFDSSTRWLIGRLNRQKAEAATLLHDSLGGLSDSHINTRDILDYLELDHPDTSFWDAFQLSNEDEDFIVVGKAGKVLGPRDLYNRWMGGETLHGLGSLAAHVDDHCMFVWELPAESRRKLHARWTRKIAEDHIAGHMELAESHARHQTELNEAYNSRSQSILLGKRVIGCTTTGAAMNHAILRKVKPDVVLVEEAGEILEAHVVSALGPSVKQLILIGDHKQLRPKVGSYRLTVEMGEGFDLNVSLFERLIKHCHKFTSLTEQHRSHPDISHFTRLLAYPHLENSPETLKRDKVRGLQSRVIFAHHEKPEDMSEGPNADEGPRSGMSKRNTYEAEMVLKTVKYLGQQGYKSKDIVVITPYLGQLLLLKSTLSHEHDAVLNDLDSFELVICHELVEETCERGHKVTVTCSLTERECKRCLKEDENVRRRVLRDFELEQKRQKQQDSYALELQELDNEIDHHRRTIRLDTERQEQLEKLNQKKRQLESLEQRSCAPWNVNESKKKHTRSQVKGCTPPSAQLGSPANEEGQTDGFASAAREEWETHKSTNGDKNAALDELMGLIGLESIKEEFLSTKFNVDIKVRQNVPLKDERLGCCMLGNPGTGKTTVARIWARFLMTIGAIPGDVFEETTGAKLANGGVRDCQSLLEKLKADGGGVLFVDEAYQLSSGNSPGGTAVIDFLLGEIENLRGKVVFVFAGYEKEMEAFLAHNPGLPSRLPLLMKFDDYDDTELLRILHDRIVRKYSGRMTAEDGLDGLYMRIASRRLGRGRGKKGFGNARAMENVLAMIEKRQSKRLRAAQLNGEAQDEYRFGKEDIIGPEPSAAARRSEAWKRLNAMIGLEKVKEELRTLVESLSTNYQRELAEEPLIDFALNRVFIRPPGTGKTTVAKLYGQILAELGFLSNGDVVVKNPSDFVGSVLGQSETLTKGILSSTVGKVLVIDEAYSLYDGGSDGSTSNLYKSAIIDTLVAEVQNVPGEDRCVIMLGYEEQMDTMFRNVNPGLSRRFSVDSPFVFEDFDDKQLQLILDLKLKNSGFAAASKAKQVALGVLRRERNRPNFGNGGAVDNLLSRAKISFQERASKKKGTKNLLEAVDFDKYFDRAERTYTNVAKLFEGEVGREEIIAFLEELQERAMLLNEMKMDPGDEIPFSFLFRGPPGTGKTTTARKMGKVYYDMGLLATANVTECSATDLIGKFDGHTGPKVQQLLDRALGQVLFIDEAYRLAGGGFAQEAVDELVDSVTKPRYQGKLIIILAGYDEEINRLLSINPGMSSGFPESINFQPLRAEDCVKLLTSLLANKKEEMRLKSEKTLDVSCLEYPSESFGAAMVGEFESLAKVAGWGNARDVKQLAKVMFRRVKLSGTIATLEEEHVLGEMSAMLKDRTSREKSKVSSVSLRGPSQAALGRTPQLAGTTAATPAQADIEARPEANDAIVTTRPDPSDGDQSQVQGSCEEVRDAGVSDEIWNQLQLDRLEEQRLELEFEKLKKAQASAGAAARDRIVRQVLAEEEKRRREEANKARLQALGVCPVGYQWIKQQGGYRCAGGSHWMADDALGAMS
ncbi:CbxX/CfqX [Drechmeria coniospora]|uniref:CbxX/CfqX n=1 Tax=Drechmeria coniospora TaxID=98403 RepID=A0A151GJ54_DRECN|nr:CbxX/CfqX [Drechmeria coniospora]KYK57109.1 CbxX/CfqX [Drechmeria coniospora]